MKGGDNVCWIGYELDLRRLTLGITAGRAAHVVTYLQRVIRDGYIRVSEFRSEVGRLSFVCSALEYERPFLGPLYSFLAVCKDDVVRPLPRFVAIACQHLADRISRRRTYPSAVVRHRTNSAPRVDARAEGEEIGIGGPSRRSRRSRPCSR